MARRPSSFARDFAQLHGQTWPGSARKPRRLHVIDEDGEVLATRLEHEIHIDHEAQEPRPPRLNLAVRIAALIAVGYAGLLGAGFAAMVAVGVYVTLAAIAGGLGM